MRVWMLVLVLVACGKSNSDDATEQAVVAPLSGYATARKSFRTLILQPGPAPQPYAPLTVPGEAEEIEYTSGRLKLRAWISRGITSKAHSRPGLLFLHGGFGFGADDWESTKPFRDAGFIVMTPMLRGENGLPGDFTLFYDEVDDVTAAADVLAARFDVDPKRIFVAGHSAGGTLTMLAAMLSKRFRAAVSMSGAPDAGVFDGEVPFSRDHNGEVEMRSPLAFATSFQCPIRMLYGDEETLFRRSTEATAMFAKAAGRDAYAVEIPGDHFSMVAKAIPWALSYLSQFR